MTCLEHIIENTLCRLDEDKDYSYDEMIASIESDINKPYVRITADEIYEICAYVYYDWYKSAG